ncbi:hypothetical protein GIB67_034739 [Kingdonia uniflora]|uniref:Uncharacterized protein n=1 Tax=Kingdonia uniflora TaxID=39325 RepID=A0A7J7MLF3_9MAGN|nr:hypothetical protein GIB67_034739 [Kingdonia uniflora]
MKRTKVLRSAALYHYFQHCLWLTGIGDDYKIALQGEVMGKWKLVMNDDEMGSQSSYRSMDDMLVARASSSIGEIEELWERFSQLRVGSMDWLILGSYNIAILNCKQGHRKALELLKQEDEKKIGELERQVRYSLVQQTANEAMVNQLNQDLAEHKAHIEFLNTRLERVHADVKSKYHMELEDLKDWLLVEQEEKRELIKKLQSAEKEMLMFRKKLEEQQRDSTSNRHFETLKQKIMKLRKENEVLKRQLNSEDRMSPQVWRNMSEEDEDGEDFEVKCFPILGLGNVSFDPVTVWRVGEGIIKGCFYLLEPCWLRYGAECTGLYYFGGEGIIVRGEDKDLNLGWASRDFAERRRLLAIFCYLVAVEAALRSSVTCDSLSF